MGLVHNTKKSLSSINVCIKTAQIFYKGRRPNRIKDYILRDNRH